MSDIAKYTLEQLEAEVAARKGKPPAPPEPRQYPDFTALIQTMKDGMAQTIKDGYENDDFQHYVYEAAIEGLYGPQYWDWRRKQTY